MYDATIAILVVKCLKNDGVFLSSFLSEKNMFSKLIKLVKIVERQMLGQPPKPRST